MKLTFASLCVSLLGCGAAMACADREAAVAAVEADQTETVETLFAKVDVDPTCDDDFRLWLGEAAARAKYREAFETNDLAARQVLLDQSLAYQPHWRTFAALADLAGDSGDTEGEARALQAAINQIADGPEHHSASENEIAELIDRASVAMLLSDAAIEAPTTRSGAPGGIFIANVRGYAVEEVKLAIEFEFDSTVMTEKGQHYANELLKALNHENPDKIILIGHTDPVGADAYNDDLSMRRAEATANFLKERGFAGEVELIGKGESDLPPPPRNAAPDSEEHHQAARRVVFQRT